MSEPLREPSRGTRRGPFARAAEARRLRQRAEEPFTLSERATAALSISEPLSAAAARMLRGMGIPEEAVGPGMAEFKAAADAYTGPLDWVTDTIVTVAGESARVFASAKYRLEANERFGYFADDVPRPMPLFGLSVPLWLQDKPKVRESYYELTNARRALLDLPTRPSDADLRAAENRFDTASQALVDLIDQTITESMEARSKAASQTAFLEHHGGIPTDLSRETVLYLEEGFFQGTGYWNDPDDQGHEIERQLQAGELLTVSGPTPAEELQAIDRELERKQREPYLDISPYEPESVTLYLEQARETFIEAGYEPPTNSELRGFLAHVHYEIAGRFDEGDADDHPDRERVDHSRFQEVADSEAMRDQMRQVEPAQGIDPRAIAAGIIEVEQDRLFPVGETEQRDVALRLTLESRLGYAARAEVAKAMSEARNRPGVVEALQLERDNDRELMRNATEGAERWSVATTLEANAVVARLAAKWEGLDAMIDAQARVHDRHAPIVRDVLDEVRDPRDQHQHPQVTLDSLRHFNEAVGQRFRYGTAAESAVTEAQINLTALIEAAQSSEARLSLRTLTDSHQLGTEDELRTQQSDAANRVDPDLWPPANRQLIPTVRAAVLADEVGRGRALRAELVRALLETPARPEVARAIQLERSADNQLLRRDAEHGYQAPSPAVRAHLAAKWEGLTEDFSREARLIGLEADRLAVDDALHSLHSTPIAVVRHAPEAVREARTAIYLQANAVLEDSQLVAEQQRLATILEDVNTRYRAGLDTSSGQSAEAPAAESIDQAPGQREARAARRRTPTPGRPLVDARIAGATGPVATSAPSGHGIDHGRSR